MTLTLYGISSSLRLLLLDFFCCKDAGPTRLFSALAVAATVESYGGMSWQSSASPDTSLDEIGRSNHEAILAALAGSEGTLMFTLFSSDLALSPRTTYIKVPAAYATGVNFLLR